MSTDRASTFLLGDGADWEGDAVRALDEAGVVLVRRCVDLADLMAAAAGTRATAAVVSATTPGLDLEAVGHLAGHGVRVIAVVDPATAAPDARGRLEQLGVQAIVAPVGPAIVDAVRTVPQPDPVPSPAGVARHEADRAGQVIAVWGPAGAPGRTTVAVGLAAEVATVEQVTLVDADPLGGTIATDLGILEEVSGLLAAARHANQGTLDRERLTAAARAIGTRLDVLTGLPRAERRLEVRTGALDRIVEVAAGRGHVVLDTGAGLDDGAGRDQLTASSLDAADVIVAVGSAEPSGLARLARGLVDLGEAAPGVPVHVVVNRMRPAFGWTGQDVAGMVEGYLRPVALHLLPEDRATLDRALAAGRTLADLGDSPLRSALRTVAASVFGDDRLKPRRAGRGRWRYSRPSPRAGRAGR